MGNGLMAAGRRIAQFLKLANKSHVKSCAHNLQLGGQKNRKWGLNSYLSAAGFLSRVQQRVELGQSSLLHIFCCCPRFRKRARIIAREQIE